MSVSHLPISVPSLSDFSVCVCVLVCARVCMCVGVGSRVPLEDQRTNPHHSVGCVGI